MSARRVQAPAQRTAGVDLDRGGDELFLLRFIRGDADGDGQVLVNDVVAIGGYLAGTLGLMSCIDAYDANDSGGVDIADVSYLFAALFQPGAPPPQAPYPDCGYDVNLPADGQTCEEGTNVCPSATPPPPSAVSFVAAARGLGIPARPRQ